ncbi:MAG: aminotransferase class V-fold PLP-dependent enzyme, partial [Aristaeellaceae bacterium]
IITTAIEHHAILHTCAQLEKEGFEVTYLPVDEYGFVTPEQLDAAIRPDTTLVSIMTANNEIGTIEPIAELAAVCKKHGVLFHTDAVQAIGSVKIDVKAMQIDMLSMSGHKFHAPKGIGVLYIRKGVRLQQFMNGGAQERNRRAGTENLASIVGIGKAIELATADIDAHNAQLSAIRDHMIDRILKEIPYTRLNGHPTTRLPGNVNVCFRFIEGESLLMLLDAKGIAGSSGSACTSGSLDPSHVLLAIGLPHEIAHGSLRLSLSEENTMEEADYVVDALVEIVSRLRSMSPLYEDFIKENK